MGLTRGHWLLLRRRRGIFGLIVWYLTFLNDTDEILSSDTPCPLDALSVAIRIALQTSLLPHVIVEGVLPEKKYEERAEVIDIRRGRLPHEERVFQVDDDWVR